MKESKLQENPKSKIKKTGYINIYSDLNEKEKRQHYYKELYKKEIGDGWNESQVFLSKEFKRFLKPNLKVLDAGCGNGNYVIDENRRGIAWAVGVDVSEEAVEKNVCLDEIIICDLEKLPFEDKSFDIVVSLWVFEHIKNPEKVLREVHRVLKKGGIFMFAMPNKRFIPLMLVRLFSSVKINHVLNKVLFGRNKEDVFEAYYKANTVSDITKLIDGKFEISSLKLNFDPSYTSFNNLTYRATVLKHRVLSKLGLSFTYAHIVGVLRKT